MGRKGIAIMLDERKEEAFCTILREELQLATGCRWAWLRCDEGLEDAARCGVAAAAWAASLSTLGSRMFAHSHQHVDAVAAALAAPCHGSQEPQRR